MKHFKRRPLRLLIIFLAVGFFVIIYQSLHFKKEIGKPVNMVAENFALLDQEGRFHELYYYSDSKAIVIIAQGNGCPIIRQSIPYLRKLKEQYESRGVTFFMINANPQDDRLSLIQEAQDYNINIPILQDRAGIIVESLGLARTGEAILIDSTNWSIVYHGAISDQWGYETQRKDPQHEYLSDALQALLAHKSIVSPATTVKGCLIPLEKNRPDSMITYTKEITPILRQRCISCHSPGGVAPWSMNSYNKVVGWGPMIREVIRTQRMPPWHADPYYGKWHEDLSLSSQEIRTLIHWIEQGFQRGEGEDPLAQSMPLKQSEWILGPPDVIIRFRGEQKISATGPEQFLTLEGDQLAKDDLWLRAIEIKPSNPKVVHHCNIAVEFATDKLDSSNREKWHELSGLNMETGEVIAGYSPGNGLLTLPEDTGIFIPKASRFIFRMHYIPTGKLEKDFTEAAFYFCQKRPSHVYSVETMVNRSIKIPAGEKNYHLTASYIFKEEVILTAIQPHMHYRGRSMKFIAEYPDGKKEILLSVPNYKFRWQRRYMFEAPRKLPAGTRIIAEGFYDNSAQNSDNPDATRDILYGPESNAEMFTGILFYVVNERLHDDMSD